MSEPDKSNPWRALAFVSVSGLDVALCLLIGVQVGRWVDERWQTSPLFLLVGLLLGLGMGVLTVIPMLKRMLGDGK